MNREVAHDFSPKLIKKLQQHATRNFLGHNTTKLHNKSITASNKKNHLLRAKHVGKTNLQTAEATEP
jgi:hypothetical protein